MARIKVEIQELNNPVSFSVKERGTNDQRFISYDSESGYIEFMSAGPGIRDYEVRIEFLFPGSGVVSFTVFQFDDTPTPVSSTPTPLPVPVPIQIPVPIPTPIPVNYCKEGPYLFGSNPIIVNSPLSLSFQFHGVEVWDIDWQIRSGEVIVRSGSVVPTSNVCTINYTPLSVGRYELFIRGRSCVSDWSSFSFYQSGVPTPAPIPVPNPTPNPIPVPIPIPIPIPTGEPSLGFTTVTIDDAFEGLQQYNRFSLDSNNLMYSVQSPYSGQFFAGFDLFPMSANAPVIGGFENFTAWDQKFLAVPGNQNNLVVEGNLTYYFGPRDYIPDYSTNMYDFYLRFPEFELPEGKMVVLQGGVGRRDTYGAYGTHVGYSELVFDLDAHNAMLTRGVTHVKGLEATKPQNSMKFLGDAWVFDVGYPADGLSPSPNDDQNVWNWTQSTTPQTIFNYFKSVFFNPADPENFMGGVDYFMWNFERPIKWIDVNHQHFAAFMQLVYNELAQNYPNTKVSVWRKSAVNIGRISNTYNYYSMFDYIKNNNLTPTQLRDYLLSTPAVGVPGGLTIYDAFFDKGPNTINHIHFYQTFLRSKENPATYLLDYIVNKKASPNSKAIATYWDKIEAAGGSDFGNMDLAITVDGNTRIINTKPNAGATAFQNIAIWSVFEGDGFDVWDIVKYNPDKREWGFTDSFFPDQNKLPNSFPYLCMKQIDAGMRGIYSISANRDIINANTPTNYLGGSGWILYSDEEFQDPIVGWKMSQDGTEMLVIISDFTAKEMAERVHNVTILGNTYQIKTIYRFATVCRVKL